MEPVGVLARNLFKGSA